MTVFDFMTGSLPAGASFTRASVGWSFSPTVPDDADALLWFAAVGTVGPTQRNRINKLFSELKAAGVYAKADDYWLLAGENTTQALTSLKRRTLATENGTPPPVFLSGQGYAFDGNQNYLNTGFTPSTMAVQGTLNSSRFGVYVASFNGNTAVTSRYATGARNTTNTNLRVRPTSVGAIAIDNHDLGATFTSGGVQVQGYTTGSRSDVTAASKLGFFNGQPMTRITDVTGIGAVTNNAIYIGAVNASGTAAAHLISSLGLVVYGAPLTASQELAEYQIIQSYMDSWLPTAVPPITLASSAVNVPRFDYDPVTRALRGLLNEPVSTNLIRNSSAVGTVAGSPGTQPTNWTMTSTSNGITREVIGTGLENGVPYIDVRFSGTASASSTKFVRSETATGIAAALGQIFTAGAFIRLVAGSLSGTAFTYSILELDNAGLNIGNTVINITPTNAPLITQRKIVSRTLIMPATTDVVDRILFNFDTGAVLDLTLRIGSPQLEQLAFITTPVVTTTVAVTRAADVLALTLENGTYNIKVNRLSGPTTYSSQLVTGTLWTVPNDPSPVQSVEATVATFVTDFTGGTLPAGVTLTRASSGSYVSGSAVGTLLSVTDLVTTSTGAGVGVTTLPVPGITASVGDMLLMACAADNAGAAGTSSTNAPITDPTGNVWARQSMVNRTTAGVSNDGTTLSIWSCLLTAPMVNNSVSIGFSTNSRASAGVKRIVGSGLAVESVGPGLTGTGGTPAQSVGPIEIVSNRAMFGWTARESNAPLGTGDTDTLGGPWSAPQNSTADTGTSGTSQTLGGQHKIPTFSSLQTFDTSGAGDYAMNYVIVSGTAVGARQLMIAGANFPRFTYDPATGVLQGLLNEPTEVNSIANGAFIGSTVGIPGTVLNSTQTGTLAPLVREVTAIGVEDGLPYVEIRISGTTSSTVSNNHGLQVVLNSLSLPTIPLVGQTWTGSIYTRLVAGSLNNLDLQFNLQERNSGTPLVTNTLSISPTNAPLITQRRTLTATLIDPTVNVLRASIFFYQPFGFSLPIDFTIRVSGLTNALSNQLTSLILTSTNLGTVGVTRATDVLTIPIPSGLYIATVERLNGTQVYYNNPVAPGAGFVVPTSGSPLRKVTLEVAPVYTGVKATPVVIVAGGQPVYAGPVTPRVMVTSGAVYDGPATPIQIVTGRDTLIGPATPMMEVVGRPVLPGPAIPVR